jgi:RimJ/RimL family protein N-acetyltransferase
MEEQKINFTVRKVHKEDATSLAKYLNNKKIYDGTFDIPHPYTLEDAENWVKRSLDSGYDKPAGFLNFIIEINGEAAGGIGIKETAEKEAELGYWLAEKYWGNGIMTAAITDFIDYAFNTVGLDMLWVDVFDGNDASYKVAKKCGFKFARENVLEKDGKEISTRIYEIKK